MSRTLSLLRQLRAEPNLQIRKDFSAPYFEFKREELLALPLPEYEDAEVEFRLPFSEVVVSLDTVFDALIAMSDIPGHTGAGLASPRRFTLAIDIPGRAGLLLGGYVGAVPLLGPLIEEEQGPEVYKQFQEDLAADPVDKDAEVGYRVVITSMSSPAHAQPNDEQLRQLSQFTEAGVTAVIQAFARLLSPKIVVLESAPAANKKRKIGPNARIKKYTLVTLAGVRSQFNAGAAASDADGRSPTLRRGCYHILRADCYARNEDGSPRRVWCKSCWVGATETTILDRRYRVLLDLDFDKRAPAEVVESLRQEGKHGE